MIRICTEIRRIEILNHVIIQGIREIQEIDAIGNHLRVLQGGKKFQKDHVTSAEKGQVEEANNRK